VSIAGVVALRGAAAFSARQASLVSLTRALAMELAPKVIVNALAVGALAGNTPAGERLISHAALKRAGAPAEVGQAALFLADPANTYTTGHVLNVDGGWSVGYARNF
jgi:NAD(P)-dependent dehydrogenase (short-subunit alcohol dehydrogenase family)